MRQLDAIEVEEVSGGLLPIAGAVIAALGAFATGYQAGKALGEAAQREYEMSQEEG